MRVLTGIASVDALTARTAEAAPPLARSVDEIPLDAREARISHRTRQLEKLADRPRLRRIVASGIGHRELEYVALAPGIEVLQLTNIACRELSPLAQCVRLEILTLSVSNRLESLHGIDKLTRLRMLSAWHIPSITSIEPVADLERLRVLFLAGAMYRQMRIASLRPLAGLRRLVTLTLSGVRVTDRSLEPLERLRTLRRLQLPLTFPANEFLRLEQSLPEAQGEWRNLWRQFHPKISRSSD